MRIETQKITSSMDKMKGNSPVFGLRVSPEGTLILMNEERSIAMDNYILYFNDVLYVCNGLHHFSSAGIPEGGVDIGAKTSSKLLVFNPDKSAEYITAKKEASDSFKFLLFVTLPFSVEFSFVDGSISPSFFSQRASKTEENIEYYESLAKIIINRFSPEVAQDYIKFAEESKAI